jgi:thioesterase domain-containing protein
MNPFEENPAPIQRGSPGTGETPLILFHDGGGTVASYYCLGDLRRTVYGIHDPRFLVNMPWKGGLPEMARVYVELLRTVLSPGENVILGGQS